jgi:hypothetical protein
MEQPEEKPILPGALVGGVTALLAETAASVRIYASAKIAAIGGTGIRKS